MTSKLVLTSLLGLAAAQTTTLSIPFYLADNQAIEASVVSANDAATTLALNCPSGTDSSDCGLFPTMLLTYGPSTYHIDMGAGDDAVDQPGRRARRRSLWIDVPHHRYSCCWC